MLFLLLACGDKDTDGTTGDSSPQTDSPVDTDDSDPVPTDSAEPEECVLGSFTPRTVPRETEGTWVSADFNCTPESVTLGDDEVEFEADGATLRVNVSGLKTSSEVLTVKEGGVDWTERIHSHTDPVLTAPDRLFTVEGSRVLFVGDDSILTVSGGDLVLFDDSGAKTKTNPITWPTTCLDGACLSIASERGGGGFGSDELVWADIDEGLGTWEIKGVEAMGDDGKTLRALSRVDGVVSAHELGGDEWKLGELDGELALLDDTVVHATCERSLLVFQDIDFDTGKQLTSYGGPFDCFPTTWKVQLADVDGDGREDQVHVLTWSDQGGDEVIGVRHGTESGWGATVELSSIKGRSYTYSDVTGYVARSTGSVLSASDITSDGKTASLHRDRKIGQEAHGIPTVFSFLSQTRPDPDAMTVSVRGDVIAGISGGSWGMAMTEDGALLSRTETEKGFGHDLDGVEVDGDEARLPHLRKDGGVDWWGEDPLTIDEREVTCGEDWFIVPAGPEVNGVVPVEMRYSTDELAYAFLELGALDGKIDAPIHIVDGELMDEVFDVGELKVGVITPGDGTATTVRDASKAAIDGELVAPSLIVTVPWDTGTECPLATVLFPGTALGEVDWDAANVLDEGTDPGCSDLAYPLGSADLLGDGGWATVMSDGTMWRMDELQIPEKVVMEKDGDFYGMQTGDFNDDGLGDAVLYGDEPVLWLSAGDGTGLEHDGELPSWVWFARTLGPGLNQPPSALFPTSWAAILD